MILLRANNEMKSVFLQMINTMGENVKWTEVFFVNNNDIILVGKGRSLFFNFNNRRVFSNIVELPIVEDRVEQITQNALLENAVNMILYVFGKWGGIKGLKVEKNYDQLNALLNQILHEIDIECVLTKDNFRFFNEGTQLTYEEVVQVILDKSKPEVEDDKEETSEENDQEDEEDKADKLDKDKKDGYKIGLWHKMKWKSGNFSFKKEFITEEDRAKPRLGNNFYMIHYKCPSCGEKLYMVVYPVGKEFRIETGEEAVYMARVYTCRECNIFYTPKPQKLLVEGDVYNFAFEDDKAAYEDYLELLGRQGERTSNCNFNQFESEYKGENQEDQPQLEEICSNMESLSENELTELKEKMDSGFYSQKSVEKYDKIVDRVLKSRKQKKNNNNDNDSKNNMNNKQGQNEGGTPLSAAVKSLKKRPNPESSTKKIAAKYTLKSNTGISGTDPMIRSEYRKNDEYEDLNKEGQKQDVTKSSLSGTEVASKALEGLKEILAAMLKGDRDFFVAGVEKLSPKQLAELTLMIQSKQEIEENIKKTYIDIISKHLSKGKEKELVQKAVAAKEKNYVEIQRLIEEIKNENCADSFKIPILKSLMELLKKRGQKELEDIISRIPENVSSKQYDQFREKIQQYKELDYSSQNKILDDKRDVAEKMEIAAFIKRTNATDRASLSNLYHKLKEHGFKEKNVKPFLEKVQDKIYAMDEAAIKKICPDPADITFDEGLLAYEEISSKDFLPELKLKALGLIDERLMKLKMDECVQLVRKFSKDMQVVREENSRIHLYDVRKMMKGDTDDIESLTIINALNTYAGGRGKYEYPILICDSSLFENGGEGFVLTPDHIYYSGLINSGVMDVMDIKKVFAGTGLLSKGIYVDKKDSGKVKISNSLKSNELKPFVKALNDFVSYLKEKPESRNISYMAKEKHEVKCCYRCGYVYEEGNVCPKCGGKFNK